MTSPSRTTDSTSATSHADVAYNLDAVFPGRREDEVGGIAAPTGEVSVRPHTQQLPGWSRLWLVADREPTLKGFPPMALSESAVSELLQVLRTGDDVDLIRESVRMVLQELIETEASDVIGAARYERTDSRVNE
jgi:hypothetical protein